MFAVVFLR